MSNPKYNHRLCEHYARRYLQIKKEARRGKCIHKWLKAAQILDKMLDYSNFSARDMNTIQDSFATLFMTWLHNNPEIIKKYPPDTVRRLYGKI